MDVHAPRTLEEALGLRAAHPGARPIAGGTDLMVALNADRERPDVLIDLGRVPELRGWHYEGDELVLGAALTYTEASDGEVASALPALAAAARTVGSPQIRNRGTIGGNLGSSSPAGDALPPLYASYAEIELASTRGTRRVPIGEFITGPKRNVLEPDELIAAFHIAPASGPQQFSKVGTRNAMVIAVCSFALALHPDERKVGTCIGSAGPTPIVAAEAEAFANGTLDWDGGAAPSDQELARFGELVAQAASPIDDVRGSAAYRRHALGVLARRELAWAWSER